MNEKVFRDPVHNYVNVDHPVIYALINSKEFQRLRRIKQLGTSGFTFHGGEHSRFSHSLGAYEIARQVTAKFEKKYPGLWSKEESLLTKVAALLHDIGHGAYSHSFERLFDTDHELMSQLVITDPETEICQILQTVAPDFPYQIASIISHNHPNKKIEQLISSQIDVDRMDYLLRDSYFSGVSYGEFDLTRILRVIRPTEDGIVFDIQGMHAVEDYIVSRYQMYMQVYFHPATRAMEVLLQNLLKRARVLYPVEPVFFQQTSPLLIPFFKQNFDLFDYLAIDDGVMNTYFQAWMQSSDEILADLASRFVNRKVFKSVTFREEDTDRLDDLRLLVAQIGFDPEYYTAIHRNFDLPYDIYHPEAEQPRTQIELYQKDGRLVELSQRSPLVSTLSGTIHGDQRFYFPREMIEESIFAEDHEAFSNILDDLSY
ncbi:HD domain-containing protein [Streptococcus merionis]|uniref:dGTP triphosphohydrolase n=1 Tax=Streptococcus merionis TaxID=400065 RepID=A0A239SSF9_9STRE|nr:HD domain-containing protein [Streptococcus merionis]SNU88209.1 dGTP triphosphohydrolase [Streptococcus merionis]